MVDVVDAVVVGLLLFDVVFVDGVAGVLVGVDAVSLAVGVPEESDLPANLSLSKYF